MVREHQSDTSYQLACFMQTRIEEWAFELFHSKRVYACISQYFDGTNAPSHTTERWPTNKRRGMRPDFWLARTHDDRYSLTPCSPLGKREYPDIQLGKSLGSFRMLTSDEAEFLVEAFGLHFKVKRLDYSSARPQTQYEPS